MTRRHNQGLVLVRGGASRAHNQGAAAIVAATWDPATKSSHVTLSAGNLAATGDGSGWVSVHSTTSKTAKRYFQITFTTNATAGIGFCNSTASMATYIGADANGVVYLNNGSVLVNNVTVATFAAWVNGDTIGASFDPATNTAEFFRNGTSVGTASAPGIGAAFFAAVTINTASTLTANFTVAGPGAVAKWDS